MRVGIANPLCGENVRGIPGACTTHNFTFMARGPYTENKIHYRLHIEFYQQKTCVLRYSNPSDMWLAICRDCYRLAYEVLRRWKKSVSLYRGFNFSSYFWTRSGGWEFDTCSFHGAGHPLHHIDNRSRNRRRNLWVVWCVSSWWPLFQSRSSVLIYIHRKYIHICSSIWVLFCLVYQLCLALWW